MSTIGDSANSLLPELTSGRDFTFPTIDLDSPDFQFNPDTSSEIYQAIRRLKNSDLTTGVGGDGTFDTIMTSLREHLLEEYEKSRITGADYVKAYIELVTAALSSGVSFLIQKDNAFWQAAVAQAQAQRAQAEVAIAKVNLQTARAQLALTKFQAMTAEVAYATGKAELAKAGIEFDTGRYNLVSMLPAQLAGVTAQNEILGVDYDTRVYNLSTMLPAQLIAVTEQSNASRAQTSNTRLDGTTVLGSIGKQKDLYEQQITSYKRDGELKAFKVWTDTWTVMKTVDEGLEAPSGFSNTDINEIADIIRTNNDLD